MPLAVRRSSQPNCVDRRDRVAEWVRRHPHNRFVGPWLCSYSCVVSNGLTRDVDEILQYLAMKAQGYDNHLKWNEEAKLKADLMNMKSRWRGVPVSEISARCRALGMREEDVTLISGLVTKAQAGRRLVPQSSYRDFRFNPS